MAKTIVITGAGRGIGWALAEQYAARGDRVVGTVRRAGTLPDGMTELVADVTDPAALAAAAAGLDTVDLLICNAGLYLGRGAIGEPGFEPEAWRDVLMANVAGPFLTIEAFLPALRAAKGRIAIISSKMGSSEIAKGRSYIYRASKAAATNLARNLATDLAADGVAVGAYHPGWVQTDMGGGAADLTMEQSAEGLVSRFDALGVDTTGIVEDYAGTPVPY